MAGVRLILRSPYLQWLLAHVFPKLRAWPVREWPAVLGKAREAEFDRFERIGIVFAVVIATWFLRPEANAEESALPFVFLSQLLSSLPLLLILAGPFFLRRIRRCLDAEAKALRDKQSNSFQERN